MNFHSMEIEDVILVRPDVIADDRGYFAEIFRADLFRDHVGHFEFVQENQSLSTTPGTVRGLHFQAEPRAQGKLVRCLSGAVMDVAVDLRKRSPTYGWHIKAELSAENGYQLWIPPGFAHGFCSLEPSSVVLYKVTDFYSPKHDLGILWNDPDLKIDWPVSSASATLSDKDKALPPLSRLEADFAYPIQMQNKQA